jgi:mRNA-degrading endonuclease toxin of MazEF toxin-antitoxin module
MLTMPTLEDVLTKYLALSPMQRERYLQDFSTLISESQLTTLVRRLEDLTIEQRRATTQQLSGIIREHVVRDIILNISSIRDDGSITKQDSYERVALYTKSAKIPTTARVHLKKRMMVHVDFAGLGTEHKGNHPAIVWHVEDSSDRVLVIPCTSFKRDSSVESPIDINIGPAKFTGPNNSINGVLAVSTIVLLDQIQPVSRKRITNHLTRNPANNAYAIARIDEQQVKRIEEGLQILLYGKTTLYDEFIKDDPIIVPEFINHQTQYSHLFRRVQVISNTGTRIEYMVQGDETMYFLHRRPAKPSLTEELRRQLLKQWIKPKAVRAKDKTIVDPSPIVRDRAYNQLLQHVQPEALSSRGEHA